ncbi:MAG TPA: hypothetical protein VH438_16650 [Gemmatimonadales bacterium]
MTSAGDDLAVARRFVERLASLPDQFRHPVLPPLLDVDPYLSAWSNVEAALGNAPESERQSRLKLATELDGRIGEIDLDTRVREASRRAVRALLSRPWLTPRESFRFVYEPFEGSIPAESL